MLKILAAAVNKRRIKENTRETVLRTNTSVRAKAKLADENGGRRGVVSELLGSADVSPCEWLCLSLPQFLHL